MYVFIHTYIYMYTYIDDIDLYRWYRLSIPSGSCCCGYDMKAIICL